ncbi:MAG: HD domain-containing protein [Oscillospiraceae bacterium]|nr:HD domain-containing protein [Oscillospiraceae bacterium]
MKNKMPILIDDEVFVKDLDKLLEYFPLPLRNHCRRVAICSSVIVEYAADFIPYAASTGSNLPMIAHIGGTFHDIGKLLVPTLIKNESDYLRHPEIGAEFLGQTEEFLSRNESQMQLVSDMVRYHHERPGGNGFPDGLQIKDIPMIAQLCAVANELDHRFYDGKEPADVIFKRINFMEGSYFCVSILHCFKKAWPKLKELYEKWKIEMKKDEFFNEKECANNEKTI